ncbi:hypothetical protein [Methylobacterium oryzihabitans]|uniref:Uncharacterized protein n=1 Tax=Methylobacterium oryzihabitans TaxID=2499852 RepID=A0A3S2W8P4_9HYPH|nr:hypothetical protein [Methylobacterium oryzihabitans]RVU16402.1 hypothetical protein EOE48_17090 [Methylobacterium oryzihabitans]
MTAGGDHPGREALTALDAALAQRPHKDHSSLSQATTCLCAFRDNLIAAGRDGRPSPDMMRLNAIISVVLAGHFPLGAVPWDELVLARGWLADLVADADG